MTALPYTGDCCPACGSEQVTPYAVLIGGSEEYGYQCLACAVMWPVLTYPAQAAWPGPETEGPRGVTAPALAPAPVPITGTGTGASTEQVWDQGHRNHPSGETRMEKAGGAGRGRFVAPPGRGCPLLPSCPAPDNHPCAGRW